MILPRQGLKKKYAYGGAGIFDSITKLLMRIFTSNAAKQLHLLLLMWVRM